MFEKVKKFFEMGLYSAGTVAAFVRKGKISAEEYEAITGQAYGAREGA